MKKCDNIKSNKSAACCNFLSNINYEKKLFKLRKEISELFFNYHLSKSMIAKKKKVLRPFVIEWTQSPGQDFTKDNRGWKKGARRKWPDKVEKRIEKVKTK